MKKASMLLIVMVVLFLAHAAAQQPVLARVEIPFQFEVHEQMLPAGSYEMVRIGQNSVTLRPKSGGRGVVMISAQNVDPSQSVKFTFRKLGLRYYLSSVGGDGYEIKTHQTYVQSEMQAKAQTIVIMARGGQ